MNDKADHCLRPEVEASRPTRRFDELPLDNAPQSLNAADVDTEAEKEWWEEEGLPWNEKPTRADYWCLGWFGFIGVFTMAMIPLRTWLLGLNPELMLALTGSRTGAAAVGALHSAGQAQWWLVSLLVGSLVAIKFDWVYWWAGKLWGRGILEVYAGQSPRSARRFARAERWALKLGWLGILVAYVPIPLPIALVVFVLAGASGMPVWRFMLLNFLAKTIWQVGYLALGYSIGEPAVYLLEQYAKIAGYVAIALAIGIVVWSFAKQKK